MDLKKGILFKKINHSQPLKLQQNINICHNITYLGGFKKVAHAVAKNFLKKKQQNFMAPFYGWGSTASRLEPLRGGCLLFTTKFPEVPGTQFIDLGRMKG